MSWQIQIYRAKPNPSGKDRPRYGQPDPRQLLAEWVDLKNVGDAGVNLSTLNLAHLQFDAQGNRLPNPVIYWTGPSSEVLSPGETVRVHTGKSSDSHQMLSEDRVGVEIHAFAESGNFVLNNKQGDELSVWWRTNESKWQEDDRASYYPNPPEGAVLLRSGQKLVVAALHATLFR